MIVVAAFVLIYLPALVVTELLHQAGNGLAIFGIWMMESTATTEGWVIRLLQRIERATRGKA